MGSGYRVLNNGFGLGRSAGALMRRPGLIWEAVRAFLAFRAHGRFGPSSEYLDWRVHTAYGDDMSAARPEDLPEFLAWRRRMRRAA